MLQAACRYGMAHRMVHRQLSHQQAAGIITPVFTRCMHACRAASAQHPCSCQPGPVPLLPSLLLTAQEALATAAQCLGMGRRTHTHIHVVEKAFQHSPHHPRQKPSVHSQWVHSAGTKPNLPTGTGPCPYYNCSNLCQTQHSAQAGGERTDGHTGYGSTESHQAARDRASPPLPPPAIITQRTSRGVTPGLSGRTWGGGLKAREVARRTLRGGDVV